MEVERERGETKEKPSACLMVTLSGMGREAGKHPGDLHSRRTLKLK